jgi:SAM-dependent methyltransferase
MTDIHVHPASFRDPAGFVFTVDGVVYRQVNLSYADHYRHLMQSGLYEILTKNGLLIPHTEVPDPLSPPGNPIPSSNRHVTLLPRQLSRISYSSEWSPEQLKDAALLTLQIQLLAMENGMFLKDATPLNIQFDNGRPILIDTLSLEVYDERRPWTAYRQFCECFLFPLFLHYYALTGTDKIARAWPDGIPVATTARLLPLKSRWDAGAWMHVFLQNQVSARNPDDSNQKFSFSKTKLSRLIQHLQSLVNRLARPASNHSVWSNYYNGTNLGKEYLDSKQHLFREYIRDIEFADALDLGCNDGWFSKILAETGAAVTAVDSDWLCIDRLYRDHLANILPLCIDLANPTPASGFRNKERASFTDRAGSDLVTALALVHHLALQNNIPLPLIAEYFSQLTKKYLLIEFIPLSDIRAMELTARKETPPAFYDLPNFEAAFNSAFRIERKDPIPGTERVLYLLKKN